MSGLLSAISSIYDIHRKILILNQFSTIKIYIHRKKIYRIEPSTFYNELLCFFISIISFLFYSIQYTLFHLLLPPLLITSLNNWIIYKVVPSLHLQQSHTSFSYQKKKIKINSIHEMKQLLAIGECIGDFRWYS